MAIERVTITIDKELLARIDNSVDGKEVRNRSHAIESLVMKALQSVKLDTVLLLAGGATVTLGKEKIPKVMVPVHGVPILAHQIAMLRKYDIRHIVIAAGNATEIIRSYFGDGNSFGVRIEYLEEKSELGSAGAIGLLKGKAHGTFAVMNADTLMNPDIAGMVAFHKAQKIEGTILLSSTHTPEAFGVVRVNGNKIVEFIERPKQDMQSSLISAGFYVFEPAVLAQIPKKHFTSGELFRKLIKQQQLAGFLHDGYTYDVGTEEGYSRALKEWKGSR